MKEKSDLNYEGKHRHGIENKDQIKIIIPLAGREEMGRERVAVKTIKQITAYQGMQTEKGSPVSGEIQFIRFTKKPPRRVLVSVKKKNILNTLKQKIQVEDRRMNL